MTNDKSDGTEVDPRPAALKKMSARLYGKTIATALWSAPVTSKPPASAPPPPRPTTVFTETPTTNNEPPETLWHIEVMERQSARTMIMLQIYFFKNDVAKECLTVYNPDGSISGVGSRTHWADRVNRDCSVAFANAVIKVGAAIGPNGLQDGGLGGSVLGTLDYLLTEQHSRFDTSVFVRAAR